MFTDVDCGYCRKLHSQIAEYNRLGVRVRYMFYPRTGPGTESWRKAEQVWCSADRKDALTRAKQGEPLKCEDLRRHAGRARVRARRGPSAWKARRRSSPQSGDCIGGYLPPDELVVQAPGARSKRGRAASPAEPRLLSAPAACSLSGLPSHSLASAGGVASSR